MKKYSLEDLNVEPTQIDIISILWESGLVVKLVLLLLIAASVVSWAIIFKKKKQFELVRQHNKDFYNFFRSANNLKEIQESTNSMPDSPFRKMFEEGYGELTQLQSAVKSDNAEVVHERLKDYFKSFGLDGLERSLKKGANESGAELQSLMSVLASIASITPFVGLFGTVWGIIDSFTGFAAGGATIESIAPGIAEALIATAVGLAAAIPAVWFYNHYNNEKELIHGDMENFSQDFLNLVEKTLV